MQPTPWSVRYFVSPTLADPIRVDARSIHETGVCDILRPSITEPDDGSAVPDAPARFADPFPSWIAVIVGLPAARWVNTRFNQRVKSIKIRLHLFVGQLFRHHDPTNKNCAGNHRRSYPTQSAYRREQPSHAAFFLALISLRLIRHSAIWIAFSAAPLRRLSDTHHSDRPFSTVLSSRMRLM